ncbi:MAG TPA: hypothetical protein DCF49_00330 [Lachnospiraceae bacterium]|nr:hypothetical protein [Lachnospiraceae bacterium]
MTTRAYPDIFELKTMLKLRKEMDEKKREAASLGFFGRKRKAALEREAAELQQKLEETRQKILNLDYPYDHPIMLAARDMDAIPYGRMTDDEPGGGESILWQLIDIVDTKALLVSRHALFAATFHSFFEDVTYEDSSVREILRDDCYDEWFDAGEKARIELEPVWEDGILAPMGSRACTQDFLFLLSEKEAVEKLGPGRLSCQGVDLLAEGARGADANVCWWLRTPGESMAQRRFVTPDGFVDPDGACVVMTRRGKGALASDVDFDVYVRPAMYVQLFDGYVF